MARVLIVEGATRGLLLAEALLHVGHAVRLFTSHPQLRPAIEGVGAECLVGTPNRLITLSGALEQVTIACWLLADASGDPELVGALHGPRLQQFLSSAIDSTLRGFLYEAGGGVAPPGVLEQGRQIVSETTARNSIPVEILTADPLDADTWLGQARAAVGTLLEARGPADRSRYAYDYIP